KGGRAWRAEPPRLYQTIRPLTTQQLKNPTTSKLQQHPRNRRRQKVRQRAGDHRAEAEAGEVAAAGGGQRADAADLDGDGGEVGEAAQGVGRDDEAARGKARA